MSIQNTTKRFALISALLIFLLSACGSADIADEAGFATGFEGEMEEQIFRSGRAAPEPAFNDAIVPMDIDTSFSMADSADFTDEQLARNQDQERLVIKNADLSIAVKNPGESMDAIGAMADEVGGHIVSSNLYQTYLESGLKVPQANITIRVPAERMLEVLALIKADANDILMENISGRDVTREYTDLNSRLRNLENVEAQLGEIMASATRTEDVLRVYSELSRITGEIELVTGQILYLENSAAMSAISVTLFTDEAVQPLTIGGWEPAGVAKDAIQSLINSLQAIANSLIWVVLYLLPTLLILALPLWLIWRGFKIIRPRLEKSSPQKKPES